MADYIWYFALELIVVLLYKKQSILLIPLQIFVDLQNSLNLFFFCCNYLLKNVDFIRIMSTEIIFSQIIGLSLFSKLIIIERSKLLNTATISIVIFFQLIAHYFILIDKSCNLFFSLFASSFQFSVSLFNSMLLFLDLINQPFGFSFMEILKLLFVFPMLSVHIVSHILKLSIN